MIRIYDYPGIPAQFFDREAGLGTDKAVSAAAEQIIAGVRARGDDAVFEYSERFDGVCPENLRVSQEEIDGAYNSLDSDFIKILELAAENIRVFHEKQVTHGYLDASRSGIVLGRRITAIERVGIYAPGGTAAYPSTVLMIAIPAKIAGVKNLVMCTPPRGGINPAILAAAKIAGVDEIYAVGGAQAVAAMAYGTKTIPRVYKIVGPGNAYVAEAKRLIFGQVDIDMIAGPSDVLVIAEEPAPPNCIAADMLAQAEHDKNSSAILLTTSKRLAREVAEEIEKQLGTLPRREIAGAAIENNSMIGVVPDLATALELSNRVAPEHLELAVAEPLAMLGGVTNAGSVFLGLHSPEALGDYLAGPNHTLPTMGTARFSSGLSVDDFVKKSTFTYYEKDALREVADSVAAFARSEGLDAHARSVEMRFEILPADED